MIIPLFTRFYTSQVVQDFFHQQYPSEKTLYHDEFFQTFGRAFSSFDEGEIEDNGDSVRVDVADVAYIFLVTKNVQNPWEQGILTLRKNGTPKS